jgi:hypothetical protein
MKRNLDLSAPLEAVFTSNIYSEIRGSVGGNTYSRVRGGAIVRNRTKPINPSSPAQALVRSRVATLAAAFGALTPEQITAWNQFAQTYPAKNALGESYVPTGKQVFFVCNLNLLSVGLAQISVPPYEEAITPGVDIEAAIFAVTIPASPGPLGTVTLDDITTDYTGGVFIVQMTPNLQASRAGYKNKYRQMAYGDNLAAVGSALGGAWDLYFGTPNLSEGQIVKLRIAVVAPDSGVSSAWFELIPATVVVD